MKKVICFFCDIRGTIKGKINNMDTDYTKFNNLLLDLKNESNADSIIFSLVSSDNAENVYQNRCKIESYLDDSIIMGRQFFDNGYLVNNKIYSGKSGKSNQIMDYLNKLDKKFDIDKVYYADDCKLFHEILNLLNLKQSKEYELHSLIPTESAGLSELNFLLKDELAMRNRTIK